MKRLECLDGLRGCLAVYVLLGHMAPFAMLPSRIQDVVSHGGAAVDVFFVLSGLVITQSLLHSGGRAKPFLIARMTRIFPVFLLVFAAGVVVQPWSCGFERMPWIGPDSAARTICVMAWPQDWIPEIIAHLTMTHGLFPNGVLPDVWVSFLGSAWSLSTEWQFYLVALLAAGRSRRFCWLLLGLAAASVAWRLSVPEPWQFSRAFLGSKGHFFALGIASVQVVRRERGGALWYGLVLFGCLGVCAMDRSIGKMLPPLVWTLCLMVQVRPDIPGLDLPGRLLRAPAAQYLGAISYCLYLVNEPVHKVAGATLSWLANGDPILFTLLWIPAAIGLPIVISVWLHVHVEAPAMRWGRPPARKPVLFGAAPSVQARGPAL